MTDTSTMRSVLDKAAAIMAGVEPSQGSLRTPCENYDVDQLVHHMVSWVRIFANAAAGDQQPADPEDYQSSEPAADFFAAAAKAVLGYQALADDATVQLTSGSMAAASSVAMMTGEYLAHGWDLATATGQRVDFTDAEAEVARMGLAPLLSPQYRGAGMPFGDIVEVSDDASGLARFLGFAGRRPI